MQNIRNFIIRTGFFVGTCLLSSNTSLPFSLFDDQIAIAQTSLQIDVLAQASGSAEQIYEQGRVYYHDGKFSEAIRLWKQALSLFQQNGNLIRSGYTAINIGFAYGNLNDYNAAFGYQQRGVSIANQVNDGRLTALSLYGLGYAYQGLGQYDNAIEVYLQSLEYSREVGYTRNETQVLKALASVYRSQSRYPEAIAVLEQSLRLAIQIDDQREQGRISNDLGNLYSNTGSYPEAIAAYQESIRISRQIPDRASEAGALLGLGGVYSQLNDRQNAVRYWQDSLLIAQAIGDSSLELTLLDLLNRVSPETVIEDARARGDRNREIFGWVSKGLESLNINDLDNAIIAFQQGLLIAGELGEPEYQGRILHFIGLALERKNDPELAIIIYKQSVNVREEIRGRISTLPRDFQQSYLESVSETYRRLADLLLQQGRLIEAQQVLELLKAEELQEFTRGEVLDVATRQVRLSSAEQAIWDSYGGLIVLGKAITTCETNNGNCNDLYTQRTALTREFNDTVERYITEVRERFIKDPIALNPEDFIGEADDILVKSGTVLIYPVVLQDKLWVLWATSGGVVNYIEVPVTQAELGDAVLCFRELLDNPFRTACETRGETSVEAVAQELYRYLMPPQLENELAKLRQSLPEGTVPNLVFSLDRVTRYIPMAALHTGDRYLIEDFTVSTILSAGLTRRDQPLPETVQETSVLALGLSEAVPENPKEAIPAFNALFHVPDELDGVMSVYAGQPLLDDTFNEVAFNQLRNHQILHIATHGEFVPTDHDLSYFLLGTKQPFRISQIKDIQQLFSNLSLVVLSACETALGAPDQDGIEINGLAHAFIRAGTNTVIASLWKVNDGSTSVLMQEFYSQLGQAQGDESRAIAHTLRDAQLSFINGTLDVEQLAQLDRYRGLVEWSEAPEVADIAAAEIDLSHPYFWAPFIIIGNGL